MRNSVLAKKNRELQKLQRQVDGLEKENKKLREYLVLYKENRKENKRLRNALVRKERKEKEALVRLQQKALMERKKQFVARFMREQVWANKKEIFEQIDFSRISMIEGKVRGLQNELDRIEQRMPALFRSNELQLHVFKSRDVVPNNVISMRKI